MTLVISGLWLLGLVAGPVFPGKEWPRKAPAAAGMDAKRLGEFAKEVGGRGCVVRDGYLVFTWGDSARPGDVASAAKPIYAHFLFLALAEKKLASLDDRVSALEPRLEKLNAGLGFKDAAITWRHLATQTSCYGVREAPWKAYDYSDWQMALFWDLLFGKVYRVTPESVDAKLLRPRLAEILGFQDRATLHVFKDRAGRLALSPRDFARFGLLYLHEGRWGEKQLLPRALARQAVRSPLPAELPRTRDQKADMLPRQRSIGGGNNQTDHDGSYSFLWWVNGVDRVGKRHWPNVPADAFAALGHGGKRGLLVVPSRGLVVSWNDTKIDGVEMQNRVLGKVVGACR